MLRTQIFCYFVSQNCSRLSPLDAIPKELILLEEAWSVDSGFANFKGGLKRKQIEQHLFTRFRLEPFL